MSIGETYNKIFGNEPSEEFSELCQEINNILQENELLKKELQNKKGSIICPKCGSENTSMANFFS